MIYKSIRTAKIVTIIGLLFSTIAFSMERDLRNTIPFASYENIRSEKQSNLTSTPKLEETRHYLARKEVIEVPTNEITEVIKKIKSETCSIVSPGTVELWVGIGADAKAVIVNSHFESGIKITFSCDAQKDQKSKK